MQTTREPRGEDRSRARVSERTDMSRMGRQQPGKVDHFLLQRTVLTLHREKKKPSPHSVLMHLTQHERKRQFPLFVLLKLQLSASSVQSG